MTTPTETPPTDPITAAFEAMLALLAALIGEIPAWTLTEIRALRPLIQRAADEHARGLVPPGLAEYSRTNGTEAATTEAPRAVQVLNRVTPIGPRIKKRILTDRRFGHMVSA